MNILVPTDFSIYAQHAFDTACQIAKTKDAHLHLYHSADIPDDWEDLPVEYKVNDRINKYIALEARDKLTKLKGLAQDQDIKTTFHYTGGKFLNNIEEVTDKVKIDLIVIGSHGASGKQEWFIGSNSQKVIRKNKINTLIVKKSIETFKPQKVVFVTSLNEEDKIGLRSFLNFVSVYQPKEVHILTIDTAAWFSQPPIVMLDALEDFKKVASDFDCKTHFYKDHSVQSGIRHFIEEHGIDLVGISYISRNPIKRLFLGSNVEMLVNHSDIPVLCIND